LATYKALLTTLSQEIYLCYYWFIGLCRWCGSHW